MKPSELDLRRAYEHSYRWQTLCLPTVYNEERLVAFFIGRLDRFEVSSKTTSFTYHSTLAMLKGVIQGGKQKIQLFASFSKLAQELHLI